MRRALPAALAAAALVWFAVLTVAPHFPRECALIYAFAAGICHQRPERSFFLAGQAFPVCARCLGLYASGAAGALAGLTIAAGRARALDPHRARRLLAWAALPTAATVVAEWLGLAYPSNVVRAAASVPLGGTAGWMFVRMLLNETREEPVRYHA